MGKQKDGGGVGKLILAEGGIVLFVIRGWRVVYNSNEARMRTRKREDPLSGAAGSAPGAPETTSDPSTPRAPTSGADASC